MKLYFDESTVHTYFYKEAVYKQPVLGSWNHKQLSEFDVFSKATIVIQEYFLDFNQTLK